MKKILLVNSVIDFHEKNGNFLDRADFHVLTASTGREALEVHRQERVNLIIADLEMPDMGGGKLCALARGDSHLAHVPILLVCGDTSQDLELAAQSGANAWIKKPITPDKFFEIIEQFLSASVRKDYRVLLKVIAHNDRDKTPFFCTSNNLSASGILFETDKLLNIGERITCSFFLPGACQIVVNGETVRCLPNKAGAYQYGVRFIDMATEFREEIEKFIA